MDEIFPDLYVKQPNINQLINSISFISWQPFYFEGIELPEEPTNMQQVTDSLQ